jgi:hypothetical protein
LPKLNSKYYQIGFLILVVLVVFFLLVTFWPIGSDYFHAFRKIPQRFYGGETQLFDNNSRGYFNPPWSIFIILPTIFLPLRYGQAVLLLFSLFGILISIIAVKVDNKNNLLIFTLALANLHTFDLLIRGNIDGLVALGIGLAWIGINRKSTAFLGAGLWLASIKPINVILPILLFIRASWHWSLREKILVVLPLIVTFALSFSIFGNNWPIRYINAIIANPPKTYLQTSLWRGFENFNLQKDIALWLFLFIMIVFSLTLIKVKNVNKLTLVFSISLNIVFSPYTLGSHYVLLASAFVVLAQDNKLFLATWLLTFLPLTRLIWGFQVAWLDILYPISLLIGSGYLLVRDYKRDKTGSQRSIMIPT